MSSRYDGADLMFLLKKGLSLIIRRLSFNSNRNFLISLNRTLKFSKDAITRILSRVSLYCIMIDQINKLPEDGRRSSPETSRYRENTWNSRNIKISCIFLHVIVILNDF